MTRRPPKAVSTSTRPARVGLDLADLGRLRRSRARRRARRARRSAASGATKATSRALVGDVHRVDAEDLAGAEHGRVHRDRRLAHDDRHTRGAGELVEHRRDAAARGVAQAAQRAGRRRRAARRRPARASACRTRSRRASSNSPRASMIAVPCSPIGPETRIRSPGRSDAGRERARGSTPPEPGRADVHRVAAAALDDLGVARDDLDAGRRRGARRSPRPRRAGRRPRGPPRARARASARAAGRRPTARSLTVPLTASSPIEPPGKRIGLTTKLSVVSARPVRRPPRRRSSSHAEGRREQPLDERLRRLAAGAVGHRDLLVAEAQRLRADPLDQLEGACASVGGHTTSRSRAKRPKL